jgi:outer membrane immunogenic protein
MLGWDGFGVGFEYGFTPNRSAGIEYDYLWRVSSSNTLSTPLLSLNVTSNTKSDVDMMTTRINYRFGGPVVA